MSLLRLMVPLTVAISCWLAFGTVVLSAACARDELAPLALDAYPEAYLDFKQALLMLVQQQQHKEWSLEARHKLAELLHQTILQHLGEARSTCKQQLQRVVYFGLVSVMWRRSY